MKMKEQFKIYNMKRECTDYDGMGNQGRFPKTKESKKEIQFDSSMIFLIFAITFFSLVFLGITINN